MPVATVVSFRLGGNDGVAVEARKWRWALEQLGFEVRRVAGVLEDGPGPDDALVPGLAIGTEAPVPSAHELAPLLDTDLVIVENLCSLPLNPPAARAVAQALESTRARVLLRHHDLAWQRSHLREFEDEFPPRIAGAGHATINLRSRRELHARHYEQVWTVHNYFDFDAPPGERAATRAAFGFADDDVVLLQPTRAIPRKNVAGGIRVSTLVARALRGRTVRYWLTGPAEDGFGPTLERLVDRSTLPVTIGRAPSSADAYAACDAVVFPSTWEGFGNPTIESIRARRPALVFPYPVLAEIVACGLEFYEPDQTSAFARAIAAPDERALDRNLRRARFNFSLPDLPIALDEMFRRFGWSTW